MAAGPKKAITADRLDLGHLPASRAARYIAFIQEFLIVPKGYGAGKPVKLHRFQKDIIRGAFGRKVRTGLVSMPRGNGKSALAAMLSLAELFAGPESAEVLIVASDQRQAMITFRMAARMIELNPELAERCHIYQDRIEVPHNGARLFPLPAEPGALHGWDPSLLIVDELHVVTRDVWEAVTSAAGKRPQSLALAISTPAASQDSIMWELVKHGREGEDAAFFLMEFSAPAGCAVDDRDAWKAGNPAAACRPAFLDLDAVEAVRRTLREPVFRQLRLGQWVSGVDSWLPHGLWESREDLDRDVWPGDRIVMGFDGSASGDSTALMGCTVSAPHHLFVVGLWENPGDPRWRVPRAEVMDTITAAFESFDVVELAADPWGWRTELESLQEKFGAERVLEWNTAHAQRMAPATDRFYQAAVDGSVSHDGDKRVAAHMAHTVAKSTTLGDLVSKDKKNSPRKIDAAVASIVALDRAAFHARKKARRRAAAF